METKNKSRNTPIIRLPQDIILGEILPRLPVKSLLRFRCVSKSWRSSFGSKQFIKTQHQNSIKDAFLKQSVIVDGIRHHPKQCSLLSLFSGETINPSPLDNPIPTETSSKPFPVLGCFNGLVCIHNTEGEFYLWNPSTRICKKLPECDNRGQFLENCGFGWDESSGEYKVFALMHDYVSSHRWVNVYSSKKKLWKPIQYNLTDPWKRFKKAVVFVGGKLYWRACREHNDITFLDLKSELFGKIEMPFKKGHWHSQLGQIGGCLCVLDHSFEGYAVQLWVMKESWERLVYISPDHELLQRPFSTSFFTHKGSNGEIFLFGGSTLLAYHPRENVFYVPKVPWRFVSLHVYVESLLSPEDV